MKKTSESAERIKALRGHATQAEFAERLGASQTTVSAWEVGDTTPSAEAYFRLAGLASYPDNLWFLKQAGIEPEGIVSIADKILKERGAPPKAGEVIRIPRLRVAAEGKEEPGPLLIRPAEFTPSPGSTKWFALEEKNASFPVKPGDIAVVDTSHAGARDLVLSPFFNTVVLMEFKSESTHEGLPTGLFVGQLVSRRGPPAFTWYAELAVLNQRLEVHRFTVGDWPAEGPVVCVDDPSTRTGWRKAEAEEFAPEAVRLYPGCEIVGLVIGWLAKPTVKSDEKTKAVEVTAPAATPAAVEGPRKVARITTDSKAVGEGKERRFVPVFTDVSKESDLRKELVMKGPVKSKNGTKNIYVTVEGKRIYFNAKTGALVGETDE
jgi:transcriptional regulator with XRE-family HTH domain